MGKVFDCRYHKYIQEHVMVTDNDYVAIINSLVPPEYDDLLIAASKEILVIDHVEPMNDNLYKVCMTGFDMGINENKTPPYRHLKRAVLSQFKRRDKK